MCNLLWKKSHDLRWKYFFFSGRIVNSVIRHAAWEDLFDGSMVLWFIDLVQYFASFYSTYISSKLYKVYASVICLRHQVCGLILFILTSRTSTEQLFLWMSLFRDSSALMLICKIAYKVKRQAKFKQSLYQYLIAK